MKLFTIATLVALTTSGIAQAATAYWTGKMEFVQTVTYKSGISCEYDIYGQKFWRTYTNVMSCPSTVEVQ